MDKDRVRQLAENAEVWREGFQKDYGAAVDPTVKAGKLNDYFYWAGKATAYRGILAMMEIMEMVEEEIEGEASCP